MRASSCLLGLNTTDTLGGDKVAVGVSTHTVGEDVSDDDNNSPDFNQSKTERDIDEDAAVGDPVGLPVDVDRNEDGDILTYEIVEASTGEDSNEAVVLSDWPFFSIDKETSQLRVAMPTVGGGNRRESLF